MMQPTATDIQTLLSFFPEAGRLFTVCQKDREAAMLTLSEQEGWCKGNTMVFVCFICHLWALIGVPEEQQPTVSEAAH